MPEAAKNYSITELEMCGLAMNITTFSHLLKKVDFDVVVQTRIYIHTFNQVNKDPFHHYIFKVLTKDCLYNPFLNPELVRVEPDREER